MTKRPTLQGARGMPAMAGLLLMGVACLPMVGCLFPQDEEVIPTLPPKRNAPLRIETQVPKEPRTTFRNTTACPASNPTFTLTVSDEDVGDVVYSRWFIGGTNGQEFRPTFIPGGNSTSRIVNAPSSLGFKSALANKPTGTEILTVYVSDTDFQEVVGGVIALAARPGPQVTLPDGTIVVDQGTYDSFTWTLDVEPCD